MPEPFDPVPVFVEVELGPQRLEEILVQRLLVHRFIGRECRVRTLDDRDVPPRLESGNGLLHQALHQVVRMLRQFAFRLNPFVAHGEDDQRIDLGERHHGRRRQAFAQPDQVTQS